MMNTWTGGHRRLPHSPCRCGPGHRGMPHPPPPFVGNVQRALPPPPPPPEGCIGTAGHRRRRGGNPPNSQNFASAPSVPSGFTLQNFRPPFGGGHRGTVGGGGVPAKPPPSPPSDPQQCSQRNKEFKSAPPPSGPPPGPLVHSQSSSKACAFEWVRVRSGRCRAGAGVTWGTSTQRPHLRFAHLR